MRVVGVLAAVLGLAVAGLIVGYGLGVLAGAGWVGVMHTSSFEGYSAMLVFFAFGPGGAIGGALALPGLYLWRLARRASAVSQPPAATEVHRR